MTPLSRFVVAAGLIVVVAIGLFHEERGPESTKPIARAAPAVDQHAVAVEYCRRIHSVLMPPEFQLSELYPPGTRERVLAAHPEYGPSYARTVCTFDRMPKQLEPWPAIPKSELVVADGFCEPWLREVRVRLRKDSPTQDVPACGDPASDM